MHWELLTMPFYRAWPTLAAAFKMRVNLGRIIRSHAVMGGRLARRLIPEGIRPIGYLTQLTRRRTGCRVLHGPFKGMKYGRDAIGSAYIPKLVGIYERELTKIINMICERPPELIVDVGAAEGY